MRELDTASPVVWPAWCYSGESEEGGGGGGGGVRGRKWKRMTTVEGGGGVSPTPPDTGSASSRSGTPSSSCTPPGPSPSTPLARNYSDFMRSLAAKYNNNNPNQNGVKGGLMGLGAAMGATQALLSMVRTAESCLKRGEASPLDLSTSAPPPPPKRPKKPSLSEALYGPPLIPPRPPAPCTPDSQTIAHWSVDDVADFLSNVDMCAEYVPRFREQRIDGSVLSLLTEEHLTTRLGMKLGPALKLRSLLSSKLGQCPLCLHCLHCHHTRPPSASRPPPPRLPSPN